jgi:tetratricopeptide (TPR) repeat protein
MVGRTRVHGFQHNQLGVTFFQGGAIDLAVEQFTFATTRAPWVSTYWLNLGVALLQKEQLDQAEVALERTLALDPRKQSAYYHLAQIYEKRGDTKSFREAFEKVLELGPKTHLGQRARERLDHWKPRIIA